MKAKYLIAALTLITAGGAALADDTYPYVDHSKFVSTKTRAEVIAELKQAQANGELNANTEFVEFKNFASTRNRDDVRKEAIDAAKVHNINDTTYIQ